VRHGAVKIVLMAANAIGLLKSKVPLLLLNPIQPSTLEGLVMPMLSAFASA
jgi:hypothetical protein